MTPQQIQEAQHYLNRILELDKEIADINRRAELIVSGHSKVDFSMSVKDQTPVSERVEIDENGDMKRYPEGGISMGVDYADSMTESLLAAFRMPKTIFHSMKPLGHAPDKISQELSETTALQILGILLEDKMRRKEGIIRALKEMGVE